MIDVALVRGRFERSQLLNAHAMNGVLDEQRDIGTSRFRNVDGLRLTLVLSQYSSY